MRVIRFLEFNASIYLSIYRRRYIYEKIPPWRKIENEEEKKCQYHSFVRIIPFYNYFHYFIDKKDR